MHRVDLSVLIADDHPVFRTGLAMALQQLGYGRVDAVEDGDLVVRACASTSFDVVILDVKMPRLNGFDTIRALRSASPPSEQMPKFIIVSAFDQPAVVRAGKELGVDAFVGKEVEPTRLAAIIDSLCEGGGAPAPPPSIAALSPRERQVLERLCLGLSAKAIAAELEISTETVRDHLGRLYAKLNVRDRAAAVHAAHYLGWIAMAALNANDKERGPLE